MYFRYIPENESEQSVLGWNTSYNFFVLSNRINSFNRRNKCNYNARKRSPKKKKNITFDIADDSVPHAKYMWNIYLYIPKSFGSSNPGWTCV